ncbi:MAG TPA: hypothetical protein VGV35_17400, partial [Bryobacteraceae bacterium]|nr:hypothetical protein [Bryobacteraceae bacterium]
MPHALLLSPDDQAVSAISAVLEEMSVSCERPLDGASAAQKLNSRSFDLVLVDCENLPAAKLIFDVCRRGKNGINPVPIAIVDGRAGLPTAFRLGAELILTKPVAKDQARNTIRTAVSRLRKEEPRREVEAHEAEVIAAATPTTTEDRALAAAAAGGPVSSQPAQVSVETPAPVEVAPAPAASIAVEEIEATSAAPSPDAVSAVHPSGEMDVFEVSTAEASDDPVLAELERSDVVVPPAIASASYEGAPRKGRNLMVAVVMLALAGGCVYGGWMYQPGLRALLRPFVNRALVFAGVPSSGKAPVPTVPAGLSKPKSLKPATAIAAAPATASPDQAQGHGLNVAADAPARAPATLPGATPSA